jgi:hypothetical protein
VSFTFRPPVPTVEEGGWATDTAWTLWSREKSLAPSGKRNPAVRPRSPHVYTHGLTNISDIPSYMQHSFKTLFKSYYIYTLSLLNLFKTTLHTTCFDRHWSSSGVLKLFVYSAVLAFCASNVRCVLPSYIRVFVRFKQRSRRKHAAWRNFQSFKGALHVRRNIRYIFYVIHNVQQDATT